MTLKQWNQIYELAKNDYETKKEIASHRRDMYNEQEELFIESGEQVKPKAFVEAYEAYEQAREDLNDAWDLWNLLLNKEFVEK